jgi:aspartyl-tRNA(Asn)/glutamyl-tRNA(Gln) amidotransferase subunit A
MADAERRPLDSERCAKLSIVSTFGETIEGVNREIAAGGRSCRDVLEGCLARVDECEDHVRAWVVIDRDRAREQADALDAELAAGRSRGPLHGIPVGIKDIVDVVGLPTAAGFCPWKDRIAERDATLVTLLRDAGAVIVGKTVTTTFAWIDPPPTRNPWNVERTPGGSSSGSAAALACGMILGAVGSQTGGSITRPASFCGVAGLKPTYGTLSEAGILPLAPSLDHPGVLARTVGDLALLWNGAGNHASNESRIPATTPRIGRLRGLFHDLADPSMVDALDHAVAVLEAAGCNVREIDLPETFDEVIRRHRLIMAVEAAAWHEERLKAQRGDYPPRIRELVEEGLAASAVEYVRCRQHQDRMKQSILASFQDVDILATPATIGPAPDTSTTGNPVMNSPWSYTGLPTVSFPIALSPEGLPLAIQLVGRPNDEARLLAAAHWCEQTTNFQMIG